jgi:hypothetical protein
LQLACEFGYSVAIRDREQGSHDLLQSLSVEPARGPWARRCTARRV